MMTAEPLGPGDHRRELRVDDRGRSYLLHIPPSYDPQVPAPLVVVFHGLGADASMMVRFCGMNKKADEAGFVTIYPNGTGIGVLRGFNAGGLHGQLAETMPDDIRFTNHMLDDVMNCVSIDRQRVYAAGMSNGAMMCYRLAVELPHRFAAIAPVAGAMAEELGQPAHAIPVIHFHGTADQVVPFEGLSRGQKTNFDFKSPKETVRLWAKWNQCLPDPEESVCPDKVADGTRVRRRVYRTAEGQRRVELYLIDGGGHTWPGQTPPPVILGKSTKDISANDLIWDFFRQFRVGRYQRDSQ